MFRWRFSTHTATPAHKALSDSPERLARLPRDKRLVNIVGSVVKTGGLTVDAGILKRELEAAGYAVQVHPWNVRELPDAHLSIFIERLPQHLLSFSLKIWFIPNTECMAADLEVLEKSADRADLVLCKTRTALSSFRKHLPETRVRYIGFETPDAGEPQDDGQRAPEFLHVAGRGAHSHRGTEALVRAWRPSWPTLHITAIDPTLPMRRVLEAAPANVKVYAAELTPTQLSELRARCRYAVQPSQAEGWGHAAREAMLAGCATIVSEAEGLLDLPDTAVVRVRSSAPRTRRYLADLCHPTPVEITRAVEELLALSTPQRLELAAAGRAAVLEGNAAFRSTFRMLLRQAGPPAVLPRRAPGELRILWLAYSYARLGGGELAAHFNAKTMCEQGARVRFVSNFATPHLPFELPDRMDVVWLGKRDEDVHRYANVALPDLAQLVRDFDANLVMCGAGDRASGWLPHVLKTSPVPVGIYCCGHDETDVVPRDARVLFWLTPTKALADRVTHGAPRIVVCPYTPRLEAAAMMNPSAQGIGLVNRWKSPGLMRGLAQANPGRRFLSLQGGWGAQSNDWPRNVECLPHMKNIGDFYSRLRVALVPWEGETFSLAGVEAQAAGVPIVAIDIPPLRESLGDGALFCPPTVEAFSAALRKLDDPAFHADMSQRARANVARYDMARDVRAFLERVPEFLAAPWSPPAQKVEPISETRRFRHMFKDFRSSVPAPPPAPEAPTQGTQSWGWGRRRT